MKRMGSRTAKKQTTRGFTLMELMVVVSIIFLLAAILMPALGAAREMARTAVCMSNQKNLSTIINLAAAGNSQLYCQAYHYNNGNEEAGAGYVHWTAMVNPELYVIFSSTTWADANLIPRLENQYICPSHTPGGFAPANFSSFRVPNPPYGQTSENSGCDDYQTARLSYCVNEAIMPRKKFSASHDTAAYTACAGGLTAGDSNADYTDNLILVNQDSVETPSMTIISSEFSDNPAGILSSSAAGGTGFKSHRPTNAVSLSATGTGGVFNAENNYVPGTSFYQLSYTTAMSELNSLNDNANNTSTIGATADDHIVYINPNTHKTGSNYAFCDGHSGKYALSETFGDTNTGTNIYLWGHRMYSCSDTPVIQPHQ